jgi:hypothetical protein
LSKVYVCVGFSTKKANSIFYHKTTDLNEHLNDVKKAYEKGAEFISLRIVKEDLN